MSEREKIVNYYFKSNLVNDITLGESEVIALTQKTKLS
jgi:hypothetical protein